MALAVYSKAKCFSFLNQIYFYIRRLAKALSRGKHEGRIYYRATRHVWGWKNGARESFATRLFARKTRRRRGWCHMSFQRISLLHCVVLPSRLANKLSRKSINHQLQVNYNNFSIVDAVACFATTLTGFFQSSRRPLSLNLSIWFSKSLQAPVMLIWAFINTSNRKAYKAIASVIRQWINFRLTPRDFKDEKP